jgi:Lysozyme like domain
MSQENGRETADRVGTINSDGSQDFGCFMVNDQAHPEFFATQNRANPVANSRYAYSIFLARRDWSAWYAVCTKNRVPTFPGIWCK